MATESNVTTNFTTFKDWMDANQEAIAEIDPTQREAVLNKAMIEWVNRRLRTDGKMPTDATREEYLGNAMAARQAWKPPVEGEGAPSMGIGRRLLHAAGGTAQQIGSILDAPAQLAGIALEGPAAKDIPERLKAIGKSVLGMGEAPYDTSVVYGPTAGLGGVVKKALSALRTRPMPTVPPTLTEARYNELRVPAYARKGVKLPSMEGNAPAHVETPPPTVIRTRDVPPMSGYNPTIGATRVPPTIPTPAPKGPPSNVLLPEPPVPAAQNLSPVEEITNPFDYAKILRSLKD